MPNCIYIVLTSTKLPSQQENIHPFTFLNKAYSLGKHFFFFFKSNVYEKKEENFSIILACSLMLLARTKTSASCGIRLLWWLCQFRGSQSLRWDYPWESFLFSWHFTWFERREFKLPWLSSFSPLHLSSFFQHTILQNMEPGPLLEAEDLKLHSGKFLSYPGIFPG